MIHEISCDMCMDLIPLVRDGVAGADSQAAVEKHLEGCESCREKYTNSPVPESQGDRAVSKAIKRVQTISVVVTAALVIMGIFLAEMVMQGSSMVLVIAVLVIRSLLRIAFGEKKRNVLKRTAALLCAVSMITGILWLGNEVFGNPVTKGQATAHIAGYLEGAYGDSDYYLADVDYIMSSAIYEGEIRSGTDETIVFYVKWRRGEVLYDTFKTDVLDIWE